MSVPPPPPAPGTVRPEEPTTSTLAQMMQHMISTMATGNYIAGAQTNLLTLGEKVEGLGTQVKAVPSKVTHLDEKVNHMEKRIDDLEKCAAR